MPRGRGLRPRGLGLRLRLDPGEQTRIRASDRPPRPRRGSVRRASPRRMSSVARFAGGGTPRRRAARRRRGDDDDRSRRRRRRPSAPRPRSRSRSLRPTEETLLRLEGLRTRPRSGRRATRAVGLGAGARRGFRASGSSRWRSRRGLAGFGDPPASSARRASSGLARRRRARPARGPRAGGRRASERTSRGRERRRPARGRPARRSRSIPSPRYRACAGDPPSRRRASRPARACARDARASRAARPRRRLDAGRGRRPRAGVRARRLEAPFAARARKGAGVRPPSRAVGECGGKARAGRPRKKDHLDPEIGEVRARKMSFTGRASFSRIRAGTGRSFLVPRASPRRARARASS